MSNSTTNLDTLADSQAEKEASANALFDAASPATLGGRRASTCAGLTWGYYGGRILVDGVLTTVSNGTVALTASSTNYVEITRAGVVSANTSAFTAGSVPLYTCVTDGSSVTSYTDERCWVALPAVDQRLALSITSDANVTLTAAQARCQIIDATSSVSLTATRNVVVPLAPALRVVYNGTTGGQSIQVIGASGTGVTIANGKTALVYADGTNVRRASADNP
jgi:hypothetical protein